MCVCVFSFFYTHIFSFSLKHIVTCINYRHDFIACNKKSCEMAVHPIEAHILKKLYALKRQNNIILIFGRGTKHKQSFLQCTLTDIYSKDFSVETVDICEEQQPDYVCDLNNNTGQILTILPRCCMIIFDYSVIKFIDNLDSLFETVSKLLIPTGIFIFDHYPKVGIGRYGNSDDGYVIQGYNTITFAYATMEEKRNNAYKESKTLITQRLQQSFATVLQYNQQKYPFFFCHQDTSFANGLTIDFFVSIMPAPPTHNTRIIIIIIIMQITLLFTLTTMMMMIMYFIFYNRQVLFKTLVCYPPRLS